MLVFLAAFSAAASADWILDASLGMNYDDNVSLGQQSRDRNGDTAITASLSPGRYFQLNDRIGWSLSADFSGERKSDYHGLDNASAGASTALRAKLGLGAYAPWVRLGASAAHRNFQNRQRDGWRYSLAVTVGKRLTDRLNLQVGYQYDRLNADHVVDIPALVSLFGKHGNAFDTDAGTLSATAVYLVSARLALILGYARHTGQVTSTTHRDSEIFDASDAITQDTVFGPDRFAYRIEANANVFSASLNYALTEHVSLDAGYRYVDAWSYEDLKYRNNMFHLQVLYSY